MTFAILVAIALFAYFIGATTGFGDTVIIVTVTVALNLYPLEFIVPTVVVLGFTISLYLVVRHHTGIDRRLLFRKILPVAGLGLPVGLLLFDVVNSSVLTIVLGAVVVFFSTLELILIIKAGESVRKPMSSLQADFWLFSGGVVHGLYASGGPLIVYYAGRSIPDKRVFRSTLSALWLTLNGVMLITNLATGKLTARCAWTAVALLPALALGIVMGEWLHPRLPERSFRILVFSVLIAAGVSVLLKSFI